MKHKIKHPLEIDMFTNYLKCTETQFWSDDIRWLEYGWREFTPYLHRTNLDLINKQIKDIAYSIYGKEAWWGKLPIIGGLISSYGIKDTADKTRLIKREASELLYKNPAVINKTTFTEIFWPYTPGLIK